MLIWVFLVLGLYFIQIYVSATFTTLKEGLIRHFGPRDIMPERGVIGARAERALLNMKENLPFFFVPALLSLYVEGADFKLAILGAQLFFFGRSAFLILYMAGVPWLRSVAYAVALGGNILMVLALWESI